MSFCLMQRIGRITEPNVLAKTKTLREEREPTLAFSQALRPSRPEETALQS